jgi:hypothetical protein
MAARKKRARRKSSARRKGGRGGRNPLRRLEAGLPPTLRPYARRTRTLADRFEKQLEKLGARYRSEATRLLREAGRELERLESRGERTWRGLDGRARRRVLALLERLQKTVDVARGRIAPARRARRRAR